jgi:pimeloyl-ACP methyl ester carboxylesterase
MPLATRTWGEGPVRIGLIHGMAGSAELWTDFAELVAARHDATVIAVDLRGHGATGPAPGTSPAYRVADFAGDVVAALPGGLDVVVGHSLGGRVLAAAVDRLAPGRAIYLDPAFSLPLTGTRLGRLLVGARVSTSAAAWQLARVPAVRPELRARFARASAAWDRRTVAGVTPDLLSPIEVAPPVVPSVLVPSARSIMTRPRLARALADAGWRVEVLARSAHDLPGLHPRETADLLADDLGAVGGRR